jgi:hypothetical protein
LALFVVVTALAGCIGGTDGVDEPDPPAQPSLAPWATVALVDTGINPYHVDFRLEGPLAEVHPSEYIPGYPAEIAAIRLTLNGSDLDAALAADEAVWKGLEAETPYWFIGTRVTAISFNSEAGDVGFTYSTGHGTMVASKAAGGGYSLCPTCHIVAVQAFSGTAVEWAAAQPWIDVQSNSWGPSPAFAWADPVLGNEPDLNQKFLESARFQAVFVAAGNGIGGGFGVLGNPSPTDSTSGPPGVIAVGGNDNGQFTPWTAWMVHIVADACANWAAVGNSVGDYSPSAGGGTSGASPYAAGAASRLILEARMILGSTTPRDVETGVFAVASANATLPASGPLADGDFTLEELKQVLFRTASPTPQADSASGDLCSPASPYPTIPVAWSMVPEGAHTWPWKGYGSVEEYSLARALEVLTGAAELPERSQDDEMYALDQDLRARYHSMP